MQHVVLGVILGPGEAAVADHQAGEDANRRELLPESLIAHGVVRVAVVGAAQDFDLERKRLDVGGLGTGLPGV